jgi:hypothetical protein
MQPDYELGDILFLVHGNKIIKCVVEEILYTKNKERTTKKYNVRPYGIEKLVPIPEQNLYRTLDEAKSVVLDATTKAYKETVEGLEQLKEDYFDMLETNLINKEKENVG